MHGVPETRYPQDHPGPAAGPSADIPQWARFPYGAAGTGYLTRDDRLVIRTFGSVAGVTLAVSARVAQPNGRVQVLRFAVAPASDRTVTAAPFDIGDGILLSVAVSIAAGTVRRGQLFVQLALSRDVAAAEVVDALLVSDYISEGGWLGWPGGILRSSVEGRGALRSIAGTNPAAGVEISETVPTGALWRVQGIQFSLVTDATAANRLVSLVLDDGATAWAGLPAQAAQVASTTIPYFGGRLGTYSGLPSVAQFIPLPELPLLPAASRIRTSTVALQAGDNFGAPQLLIEEWLQP